MVVGTRTMSATPALIDQGSYIDGGGGDGIADLWPTIGGVEYHIHIKTGAMTNRITKPNVKEARNERSR